MKPCDSFNCHVYEGDRVRLRFPEGFVQPWRKLGEEGRLATVTRCFTPAGSTLEIYRIVFDVKRKNAVPHELVVDRSNIEVVAPVIADGHESYRIIEMKMRR